MFPTSWKVMFLSRGHIRLFIATHEHSPKDLTQRIVWTQRECWFYVFFFQLAMTEYIHAVAVNFHQLPVKTATVSKRMVHYVFQVAWYCSLGMSSIFSILWPVTAAKTIRVSFRRLTTLWDQTIVIDITLVIFTNISWLTSKDFFVFFVFFLVVETKMSQYWDWDYFFGAMDSSGSSGSAGSAAEEMVRGVFCGKRSQVQKNKGTMQFETWTWRWF